MNTLLIKTKRLIASSLFIATSTMVVSSLHAAEYQEEMLGRLFTTPDERQKIDSVKRGEDLPQTSVKTVSPSNVNINGVVIRKNGKNTVWVNGSKSTGNISIGNVKILGDNVSAKTKQVPIQVDGKKVFIKPGQAWSEETGKVVDRTQ